MNKFISSTFIAALAFCTPQLADAKEFKYNWKRTISSGNFDQDTSFFWVKPNPEGGCFQDDYFTVKVKKKPKHGTFTATQVVKVLTSGPCAGISVNALQFFYQSKRRAKNDKVVIEIGSIDRLPRRKDVDSARIEIKIKKK
jgi:hypothetical protein